MSKEEKFWSWFNDNNSRYYYLNQHSREIKEQLLTVFENKLHEYCDRLYFEIGGRPNEAQELIISAGGNVKFFKKAEKLVNESPQITDWQITALKPAMGINFKSVYEGLELDPQKAWFLPLISEKVKNRLALRLYFENYEADDENRFLNGSYQIIDTILGEKSASLDIDFLEVDKLPLNPPENGLIELVDLPEYIRWRKSKM